MQARTTTRIEHNANCGTIRTLTITVYNSEFHHDFHISELESTSYSEWMSFFNDRKNIGFYSGSGGCISYMGWAGNRIRIVSESSGMGNDTTQTAEFNAEPLVTVLRQAIEELHKSNLI